MGGRRNGRVGAALFLCIVGVATPARSQDARADTHYGVRGIVRDSGNAPISSAKVSVYGFAGTATTDSRGQFSLGGLMRGTRVLEIVALGYKPRLIAIAVDDSTPEVAVVMARARVVVLDSVRVSETRFLDMPITSRRTDRITEAELGQRDLIGGTALEAFALLRPQLFHGRPAVGLSATNSAAQRSASFPRDTVGQGAAMRIVCVGNRACEIDAMLSVSINEGRPGSPDILTTLPVRIIKEMRYLLAVDASARFGIGSGGGPVLVVYTR
jgi:hypothetical protein